MEVEMLEYDGRTFAGSVLYRDGADGIYMQSMRGTGVFRRFVRLDMVTSGR